MNNVYMALAWVVLLIMIWGKDPNESLTRGDLIMGVVVLALCFQAVTHLLGKLEDRL